MGDTSVSVVAILRGGVNVVRKLDGDESPTEKNTYLLAKYYPERVKHGKLDWATLNWEINALSKISSGQRVTASSIGSWAPSTRDILTLSLRIQERISSWVDGYVSNYGSADKAYPIFQMVWKACRAWVPLQLRLCAEQVFYNKGDPWRKLVSGFKPL